MTPRAWVWVAVAYVTLSVGLLAALWVLSGEQADRQRQGIGAICEAVYATDIRERAELRQIADTQAEDVVRHRVCMDIVKRLEP